MELNREVACRVAEVVGKGLVNGLGTPEPGNMCVEAAVCFALGLPHGDDPPCVGSAVRAAKITLNDAAWSSNEARSRGMMKIAIAQLGSDEIDQIVFSERLAKLTIQRVLPPLLRANNLPKEAEECEREGTEAAARAAARAAAASAWAEGAAARAAAASARAVGEGAWAVVASAWAARAAAWAVETARAGGAAAGDIPLFLFADLILEVLVELKSPGVQWLDVLEESK